MCPASGLLSRSEHERLVADDIEVRLRHIFLSQTALCLHQYKTDHLINTVLQPSTPKLPLNLLPVAMHACVLSRSEHQTLTPHKGQIRCEEVSHSDMPTNKHRK